VNAATTLGGAGSIQTRRCARHSGREAAARCPACGGFFCRECIVEHEGQLLCTACLAKAAASAHSVAGRSAALRRRLALVAATLAALLVFYGMGSVLLNVPPEFHRGTIWVPRLGNAP
jgi:hypothetical protein